MNPQKYEIKAFSTTNLKKDGTEIKNKFGKVSWRTTIQVPEHGQQWITGFLPFQPDWKVGDTRELIIYEGDEYNGAKQLNFRLPNKEDKISKALEEIRGQNTKILLGITEIHKHLVPPPKDDYPEYEGPANFDIGDERAVPPTIRTIKAYIDKN